MPEYLKALVHAGTAVIADAFDALGEQPPILENSIRPIEGKTPSFIGPAYTITGNAEDYSGGDRAKLAAIDAMTPGVVALWAGMDVRGACLFGDLLASAMQARGCAGAVVDGGVRDVAFLRESGLSVYARYFSPAQGIGRWRVTGWQIPVQVRGAMQDWIEVNPGDLVAADEDGVIIIPQSRVEVIVSIVRERAQTETAARGEIQKGLPLVDVFDMYGHL